MWTHISSVDLAFLICEVELMSPIQMTGVRIKDKSRPKGLRRTKVQHKMKSDGRHRLNLQEGVWEGKGAPSVISSSFHIKFHSPKWVLQ